MRIATGLTSDRGATELEVTWPDPEPGSRTRRTWVGFIGEHQNSEEVRLTGRLTCQEVLAWYLDQMRMASEEAEWGL